MTQQFLGEIRCFGFNFAPRGWASCNGQSMSIAQNTALFSILGTTYGGDGQTTFGLPNLQGRIPMHYGDGPGLSSTVIGEVQGVTTVTLTASQMPTHSHAVASVIVPPGGILEHVTDPPVATSTSYIGPSNPDAIYKAAVSSNWLDSAFAPNAISLTGGSLPHENMQPYLALNFCIALQGIFPSRN